MNLDVRRFRVIAGAKILPCVVPVKTTSRVAPDKSTLRGSIPRATPTAMKRRLVLERLERASKAAAAGSTLQDFCRSEGIIEEMMDHPMKRHNKAGLAARFRRNGDDRSMPRSELTRRLRIVHRMTKASAKKKDIAAAIGLKPSAYTGFMKRSCPDGVEEALSRLNGGM